MNLLVPLALVVMIVAFLATVSAWSLWRAHSTSTIRLLALIGVPVADTILAFLLLDWWLIDGATRLVGAISFGVISLVFVQPLLIPQRLVVWRLARETVMRRKRQAALLMLGLIIASAIITSSLVVGDSLDATVQYEVEGAWGETDITIGGFDLSTGERVTISEDVSSSIWNQSQADLQLSKTLLGQQRGLIAGVSVEGQERSLPSITWLAFDGSIDENEVWPGIGGSNGVRYAEIATTNAPERPLMVVVNALT